MIPLSTKTKREWKDPKGYRFLAAWSNSVLLEILVRKFTVTIVPPINSLKTPLYSSNRSSNSHEYRLKAQLDDAARSTVSNIVEGFKRPTTKEYLEFLGFSQGSLEEVGSDMQRCLQNKLLKSIPGSSLLNLGIDLKVWNEWCKNPLNSSRFLYFTLKESYSPPAGEAGKLEDIKGEELSYEIFIELINKTDYLLRTLVASLQKHGDYQQELKKDPHREKEIENDKWLEDVMKKYKSNV